MLQPALLAYNFALLILAANIMTVDDGDRLDVGANLMVSMAVVPWHILLVVLISIMFIVSLHNDLPPWHVGVLQ